MNIGFARNNNAVELIATGSVPFVSILPQYKGLQCNYSCEHGHNLEEPWFRFTKWVILFQHITWIELFFIKNKNKKIKNESVKGVTYRWSATVIRVILNKLTMIFNN